MDKVEDQKDYKSVQEQIAGTSTPYYHIGKPGFFRNLRLGFYRVIGPINPFAKNQVEKKDDISFLPQKGRNYALESPLPNPVRWNSFYPSHFDSTQEENSFDQSGPSQDDMQGAFSRINFETTHLPLACERQVQKYKRCQLVNGDNKCEEEGNDVVLVCPNFALDEMRKNKIRKQIAQKIQLDEYKEALRVPEFNQRRTIQDVDGSKSKIHGTRKFLRPDTFWADERYVNVTQEDIDEAKLRHEARVGKPKNTGIFHMEKLNQAFTDSDIKRQKPLYGLQ